MRGYTKGHLMVRHSGYIHPSGLGIIEYTNPFAEEGDPSYAEVIHIESGFHINQCPGLDQARELVEALAPLTDWNKPEKESLQQGLSGRVRDIYIELEKSWK